MPPLPPFPELLASGVLFALGLAVGLLAGLIGIGGALLSIPALLYFFPWLFPAHPRLPMAEITGITALQSLAGTASSLRIHWQRQNVTWPLVFTIGPACMAGGYIGGFSADWFSDHTLKVIYALLLTSILVISYLNRAKPAESPIDAATPATAPPAEAAEAPPQASAGAQKDRVQLLAISTAIGYLSGLMGVGGAVFLVPLLHHWLKLGVRQTIGTSTGIIVLTCLASVAGKWHAGLVPWHDALIVSAGALIGGQIGARWGFKTDEKKLFAMFLGIVVLTLGRVGFELLFEH